MGVKKSQRDSANGVNLKQRQDNDRKKSDDSLPSTVYIVFASLVCDLIAFTVILPLFPAILEYYDKHQTGGLYGHLLSYVNKFRDIVGTPNSPRWNAVLFGGLLGSLFSFLQFLTSPLYGAASDVYGRRKVLLVSLVGIVCSYAIWLVSHNFAVFAIARFIGGISKGNVSLCTAIATDVTSPRNRSRAMAMIGVAFSIGFLIGPLIGAVFASYARKSGHLLYTPPAIFALVLATVDALFVLVMFPESLPTQKRAKSITGKARHIQQLLNPVSLFKFSAIQSQNDSEKFALRRIGLTYFLYLVSFASVEFTLTFLFHIRFQYTSMQQGLMFCYVGVIMALTQGGYVRRVKPGAENKTALMAILVLLPSILILAFTTNIVVMYIGLALYAFASGVVVPCLTSLVSTYGQPHQKGAILGIFRSLGALSRALAPAVACSLFWSCGAEVCYLVVGAGLLLPIYLLRNLTPHKVKP